MSQRYFFRLNSLGYIVGDLCGGTVLAMQDSLAMAINIEDLVNTHSVDLSK